MISLPQALDVANKWLASDKRNQENDAQSVVFLLAVESLVGHINRLKTDDLIELSASAHQQTIELISRLTLNHDHTN